MGSVAEASGLHSTGSIVVVHGLSYCTACGNFPDQRSNPCLWHWQVDSLPLSHQGSPPAFTVQGDTSLGNILGFSPYLLQVINPSFCSWAWLCLLAPHPPRGEPSFSGSTFHSISPSNNLYNWLSFLLFTCPHCNTSPRMQSSLLYVFTSLPSAKYNAGPITATW